MRGFLPRLTALLSILAGVAVTGRAAAAGLTVMLDPQSAADMVRVLERGPGLVHAVVSDPADAARLDAALLAAGTTGRGTVSVRNGDAWPFVAETVSLVIADADAPSHDMMRVLAPNGRVVRPDSTRVWQKPWPDGMDEWPQYLHGPDGNMVSQDARIGPPRQLRWTAGPKMLRHHDHLPSLNAMVSSGGRVFYILDGGSSASILFPPNWQLIARDAFNGATLWKTPISDWHPHLWPLKSMPATLPRRLVAMGDRLYVTLGIRAPVSQLDAATGVPERTFAGSDRCEEIVVIGDTLLAVRLLGKGPLDDLDAERGATGKDGRTTGFPYLKALMGGIKSPLWLNAQRRIIAYDRDSGNERWHVDTAVAPLSLAADETRVYIHNGAALQAFDLATGADLWTSDPVPVWEKFYSNFGASLVVHENVVIFSGGENYDWQPPGTKKGADDTMTAVSALDGRKLWSASHPSSGYRSPEDLLVADGLVWAPNSMKASSSTLPGLDPETGEVVRSLGVGFQHGFHHRCYAARATETFLLASKVGINALAWNGDGITNDHWVRGACGYGFMPANGLIYATPDPCNCFPESKLNGFAALATRDVGLHAARRKAGTTQALQPGRPITGDLPAMIDRPGTWPTHRSNSARNAHTANALPARFEPIWETDLPGPLSAPVVAAGKVFIASIDRHLVTALDADSGALVWTHLAGGRVDSPPTVVGDLVYVGAADGTVTCLHADDGAPAWRTRIAPTDERIVCDDRLESVWPVHGSVTYHNGLIYAVAGRNMFVDGGLTMCALDPLTGVAKHTEVHGREFTPGRGLNTIPSKPDLLAASEDLLFMRSLAYDTTCRIAKEKPPHIFAVNGFLNDTWFHRSFWTYSNLYKGGPGGFGGTGNANHSGRIMAWDDTDLYAFGRDRYGWGSAFTYRLYKAPLALPQPGPAAPANQGRRGKGRGRRKSQRTWSVEIPILPRCLVKAGERLIAAGPKRLYDENRLVAQLTGPEPPAAVRRQAEAWSSSADLIVVDAENGSVTTTVRLGFAPVWDSLVVAEKAVFITGQDGTVRRLE